MGGVRQALSPELMLPAGFSQVLENAYGSYTTSLSPLILACTVHPSGQSSSTVVGAGLCEGKMGEDWRLVGPGRGLPVLELVIPPREVAAPTQLNLPQHGVDAGDSGPLKDFCIRNPVLLSQLQYSSKAAELADGEDQVAASAKSPEATLGSSRNPNRPSDRVSFTTASWDSSLRFYW
ncbi:hypothetical protein SprV_0602118700 [Sparganum proliferum]